MYYILKNETLAYIQYIKMIEVSIEKRKKSRILMQIFTVPWYLDQTKKKLDTFLKTYNIHCSDGVTLDLNGMMLWYLARYVCY